MRDSTFDVDKARVIAPTNHVPKVVELNSNFTTYIAELNPETSGESTEPELCGSTPEVAEKFKPELKFHVKKLNDIGKDELKEETVELTMKYGANPKDIMNDFTADHLVVKAESEDSEKILLDQQLDYLALEDLQERIKDKSFLKAISDDKDAFLKALDDEIERINNLKKEIENEKALDED